MSTETFPSSQMDTWSDLRRDKETICMEVGNRIFHKKKNNPDAVESMTTNPNKEKRRNHW